MPFLLATDSDIAPVRTLVRTGQRIANARGCDLAGDAGGQARRDPWKLRGIMCCSCPGSRQCHAV
eukprot:1685097-Rhodomonas_salina.2